MATRGVNGVALAAIAAGALLTYSGVSGKSTLAVLQASIRGGQPKDVPETAGITASPVDPAGGAGHDPGATVTGGSGKGAQIAADALTYDGAGYVFGGAPAAGIGHWDCSSFVNKVVGIDNGLPIPGYKAGAYTGTGHGPPAIVWQAWTGATTIGHDGAVAEPGDLCCWQTHIGIAIGGGRMISARSAKDNPPTGVQTIASSHPAEFLSIRRLEGI